jgi:hypothetical protein
MNDALIVRWCSRPETRKKVYASKESPEFFVGMGDAISIECVCVISILLIGVRWNLTVR